MTDCGCTNFPSSLGNVTFGASVGIDVAMNPGTERLVVGGGGVDIVAPAISPAADAGLGLSFESYGGRIQSFESKPLILQPLGNNVGVQTTSPLTALHVAGSTGLHLRSSAGSPEGGRLTFFGDGTGWRMYIQARNDQGTLVGSTPPLTIVDSGNVGIGTSSPANLLDVAGTMHCTGILLGGNMNLYGTIYDSTGTNARVDANGCYYAN